MLSRAVTRSTTAVARSLCAVRCSVCPSSLQHPLNTAQTSSSPPPPPPPPLPRWRTTTTTTIARSHFHTASSNRASGLSADQIMENLNDLYATAKDEFEIAAEGTEDKTVYAAEDREAAKEALSSLKSAFDNAIAESEPEVAAEVQKRVGQRIRELDNAVTAMEERALED